MPAGGLHTALPKAQIRFLLAQASRDPSQGDVQCQRRIGGRPPPINTPPRWSPRASPGSSCVATLTTETPTKLHQLKPMTGPMVPAGAGGCDFLADPNRRADQSPVFWRSDELASVIVLTAAPASAATPSVSFADFPSDSRPARCRRRRARHDQRRRDQSSALADRSAQRRDAHGRAHPAGRHRPAAHRRGAALLAVHRARAATNAARSPPSAASV